MNNFTRSSQGPRSPLGYPITADFILDTLGRSVSQPKLEAFILKNIDEALPPLREPVGETLTPIVDEEYHEAMAAIAALQPPQFAGMTTAEMFQKMADELAGTPAEQAALAALRRPIENIYQLLKQLRERVEEAVDVWEGRGFNIDPGWYELKLSGDQRYFIPVDYPNIRAAVYDVETYVQGDEGEMACPIIGQALGFNDGDELCLFIYLDGFLLEADTADFTYERRLLSMGPVIRYAVGHNAAYDRVRTAETYTYETDFLKRAHWICTQSLTMLLSGVNGWVPGAAAKGNPKAKMMMKYGCAGSLVDSYNFHVVPLGARPLTAAAKEARNIFVECKLDEIRAQLGTALVYSAMDVIYTWALYTALYAKQQAAMPLDFINLAFMCTADLLMPVGDEDEFRGWLGANERKYQEIVNKSADSLKSIAVDTLKLVSEGRVEVSEDVFLSDLDWRPNGKRHKAVKTLEASGASAEEIAALVAAPRWTNGISSLSLSDREANALLRICWVGASKKLYPMVRRQPYGYIMVAANQEEVEDMQANGAGEAAQPGSAYNNSDEIWVWPFQRKAGKRTYKIFSRSTAFNYAQGQFASALAAAEQLEEEDAIALIAEELQGAE